MKKRIFTIESLSSTPAGKLLANQQVLTRKEMVREKLIEDPNMINRGYKHGWIIFGERVLFVRSSWDANICAFLQFQKDQGLIKEWEYEPETYWFSGVKRGTNSYKPDFRITPINPLEPKHVIEVKAYWTSKDTVKMKRMNKYFPSLPVSIICNTKTTHELKSTYPDLVWSLYANYDDLAKQSATFPGWGQPMVKRNEIQHLLDAQIRSDVSVFKPKKKI